MTGAKKELGLAAYSEAVYPRYHFGWSDLRALTAGRYKYIDAPRPELYDLAGRPERVEEPVSGAQGARRSDGAGAGRARSGHEGERVGVEAGRRGRSRRARAARRARLRRHDRQRRRPPTATGLADPKDKIQLFNLMTQARETSRHDKKSDDGLHALERVVAEDPKVIDAWFMLGNEYYRQARVRAGDHPVQARARAQAGLRSRRHQHGERLPRARARQGGDDRVPPVHGARSEERADPLRSGADPDRQRVDRRGRDRAREGARRSSRSWPPRATRSASWRSSAATRPAPRRRFARRSRRSPTCGSRTTTWRSWPSSRATSRAPSPSTSRKSSCTRTATRPSSTWDSSTRSSAISRREIDAYRHAIEMNPSFAEGHLYLAKALLDSGRDLDEAVTLARKGIELAPTSRVRAARLLRHRRRLLAPGQARGGGAGSRQGARARAAEAEALMPRRTSRPPRSVLMIGSEALPFAKTGGLADVLGALPSALARLGWTATVALPRYRGVDGGHARRSRFPSPSAATRARSASTRRRWPTARARCSSTVRSSTIATALYGVGDGRLSRQRAAVRPARRARRSSSPRAAASRPIASCTRTTGRPASRPSTCARSTRRIRCSAARRASSRFTTSPIRGCSSPTGCRASICGWDAVRDRSARVLGPHQLPQGRHQRRRRSSRPSAARYAEEIQTPEFGFGFDGVLRARARRSRRHPERHRHARVGSGARSVPAGAVQRGRPRRARPRRSARCSRASACRPTTRRWRGRSSGMISRMVDQKGFDLIARARRRAAGARRHVRRARHRRGALPGLVDGAGRARIPIAIGARIGFDEALAHLIEGGRRHLPDAVAVRAVRAESDVQPALRHGAGRARGRRPGRHGARLRARGSRAATGFVFADYTPAALLGALRRALALFADRRRWRALQAAGMRQDFSWDRSAREYVKIYERAVRQAARWLGLGLDGSGGSRRIRERRWHLKTCRPLRTAISKRR